VFPKKFPETGDKRNNASCSDYAMVVRTANRNQTMPLSTLKETHDGEEKSEENGEEKSQKEVT
jgi:hypothetical protein